MTDGGEEVKTFMGRTSKSWFQILGYYVLFYGFLMGFFLALFNLFMIADIDSDKPKWIGDDSVAGAYPGIVIKPTHDSAHMGSRLYRLNLDYGYFDNALEGPRGVMGELTDLDNAGYAARLEYILRNMEAMGLEKKAKTCNVTEKTGKIKTKLKSSEWCHFDIDASLGKCGQYPFGYDYHYSLTEFAKEKGRNNQNITLAEYPLAIDQTNRRLSPCFFVKVNRMFETKMKQAKSKKDIKNWPPALKTIVEREKFPAKVFIHCQGKHPEDQLRLNGTTQVLEKVHPEKEGDEPYYKVVDVPKLEHMPADQGIGMWYFPMRTKDNKENGYVAIKFNNAEIGQMITVQCQIFYKGHDSDDATDDDEDLGKIDFQLFVEDEHDYTFNN